MVVQTSSIEQQPWMVNLSPSLSSSPLFRHTVLLTPEMGVVGVIRKALKLPAKDEKLFVQAVLLVLTPLFLLVVLHYLVAGPLMAKVEDSYEISSSVDPKDGWTLLGIEVPFFIAFFLVWLFGTSITIFASAKSYNDENPQTLGELLSWTLLPSMWKKLIVTWLYLFLLMIVYSLVLLFFIPVQLKALVGIGNAGVWVAGISVAATYPYLAGVWTLGLVISVLEEDGGCCYGSMAIKEAQRLMGGRRVRGYLLMLFLLGMSAPISILFYLTAADDDDEIGTVTRFSFMLVSTALFCLTNLFTFVAFTVFYFDCKQGVHVENMGREFRCRYSSVLSLGDS